MDYPAAPAQRMHPLMVGATASVILVSLLGVAAIAGVLPSSHSTVAPVATIAPVETSSAVPAKTLSASTTQSVTPISANRFVTADGRVLEDVATKAEAPATRATPPARVNASVDTVSTPVHRPVTRHVHHYPKQQLAQMDAQPRYERHSYPSQPIVSQAQAPVYQSPQPVYQPQQPVYQPANPPVNQPFANVNPLQTGVGAVIGGLLGSQVGGGNGRTLATVAGAIAGGYAGNEISHGRSPIPTW